MLTNWFKNLPPKQQEGAPYLALTLAVLAAYANVYHNDFVFDDFSLIVNNQFLKSWEHLPDLLTSTNSAGSGNPNGFYRPIPALVHFLVYQAFGASVVAFHAINVALHALTTCLVYLLGRRLNFGMGAAVAGALLWGLHPLHTEAVTFMASTPEILWTLFSLLGLVVLLPDFSPRKIGLAAAFFILALGCKQAAMIFPALATICLFLVTRERYRFTTYVRTWPLWLLTVVYITVLMSILHALSFSMVDPWDDTDFTPYTDSMVVRLFTSLATLPAYVKMILWPSGLHVERTFPIFTSFLSAQVLAGAALVVAGLFLALKGRVLPLTFGILWFAVALSPSTGVLVPINAIISEHWMYFPTIGLFLGLTGSVPEKYKNIAFVLVMLAAVALGVKTHFQNRVWANGIAFNENIIATGGRPARAHAGLIEAYMSAGDFDKVIEHYKISQTLPHDNYAYRIAATHTIVALAYLRVYGGKEINIRIEDMARALPLSPHIPEAIEEFEKAIEADPTFPPPYDFLSMIYGYQGDTEKAALYHQKAGEALRRKQQ